MIIIRIIITIKMSAEVMISDLRVYGLKFVVFIANGLIYFYLFSSNFQCITSPGRGSGS